MEAYIVPGWMMVIAGLVIYRRQPEIKVLLGLRSAREEAGERCLPTGLGAIRRDITSALATGAPESLENPAAIIQSLPERQQLAFSSLAGFALAEARWYVDIPSEVAPDQLYPLPPISQLTNTGLSVKIYYALDWGKRELPEPAQSKWPFQEVKFFSRKELEGVSVAFRCDRDLEEVFWNK